MKLLLTSAGFKNQSIIDAFESLLEHDISQTKLVFIPTAANVEKGGKEWLIDDLYACARLGLNEIDIVDIAAVSKDIWSKRLEQADVMMVGGGNAYYLMDQMKKSGLAGLLPDFLKTHIYIGISAGSMVMAPKLQEEILEVVYDETFVGRDSNDGLGFVDFLVVPHLNSPHFPRVSELIDEVAKGSTTPLYAIDDQTAVRIVDNRIDVVSEGTWKKYN